MTASVDSDLDARLERLIQSDPAAVADPFALYRDLLERSPVHRWGPTVVVSRHADVKAIARDAVTFSNRAYSTGSRAQSILARLTEAEAAVFHEISAFEALYISRQDGAEHARLRDIAHRAFTPRKMAELTDLAQRFTDELLERMIASGESDFVQALSSRLPVLMINSLLDVPLEDVDLIKGWAARIGKNRGGAVTADLLDAHAALDEFRAYVAEIVAHHRRHPEATTLVSALMGAASEDRLTNDELLATMVVLLFAGTDTTTALLGNGLHALLSDREQWELLCADPDARMAGAVEELLRFISPVQTTWRVTTTPTTIGGVDVPAGNTVLVLIGAADRDPAVYPDPDRLDIAREARHHLALWFGAHFCLGASLARMEARTVLGTLARRFPGLHLRDPEAVPEWRGNIQFRTIASLDVELR
jgi:cytochrome P450